MSQQPAARFPWLFHPWLDLAAFLGSALVSLAIVGVIWATGGLEQETPEWLWIVAILMIDVAHVYATCFRVYFRPLEIRRRRWLYILVPILAYIVGWAVYSESPSGFWITLAYIAVFHFVRQQYGWVALYRAKGHETDHIGWWIDAIAIYLATMYPLVYWHARSRHFEWFESVSFPGIAPIYEQILRPFYWMALAVYLLRSLSQCLRGKHWNPGKDLVVLTTAVCWYVGIVAFNSDIAFTVTNVVTHGVPYMILVAWDRERHRSTANNAPAIPSHARLALAAIQFLGALWFMAYAEELLWDRGMWHRRSWLFGEGWDLAGWQACYVPLLATPQLTHYILDGFIWRRRSNPDLAACLDLKSEVENRT